MNQPGRDPRIALFIARLGRLDSGGRARLKRNAGRSLSEARRQAFGLFFSLLPPGISDYQSEMYFMVATLFPAVEAGSSGDLGDSLHRARNDYNGKGLDRRVIALLDADQGQLPDRLRRTLYFLQSNRVHVNWEQLLDDVLAWNAPERRVQRRWARSYFTEGFSTANVPAAADETA